MSVSRPGSFCGLSTSTSASSSSGVIDGPTFTPIGLAMPRKYSTWAPSSGRVRSPIQGKWVQRLYHLSRSAGHLPGLGLLVIEVQALVAGEEIDPRQLVQPPAGDGLHEMDRRG